MWGFFFKKTMHEKLRNHQAIKKNNNRLHFRIGTKTGTKNKLLIWVFELEALLYMAPRDGLEPPT